MNSGLSCPRDEPGWLQQPTLPPDWIRERQVVLAKEPRGSSGGSGGGAEALTHVQKIAQEREDAAASLRLGTWAALRLCCRLSSTSRALAGGGGGQRGAFFPNRGKKKKIICLQLTSSHSGWLQETCAPAARDTTVATATAKQGDSSTPSLCHPPPPQNKAEREGGDGESKQLVGMTLGSRGQGCYVLCSRPATASAQAPLHSHRF